MPAKARVERSSEGFMGKSYINKLRKIIMNNEIKIRGARTHNLKNINLDIPREKLVVLTGLSGSGKSSLAFDTLYAEGQRRYVESLSAYARQFLQLMEKPDVDTIEGLSPAISIEQKATSHNPRSTVGTVTEIHDYLRLLFARAGTPHCPDHDLPLEAQSVSQMVDTVLSMPEDTKLMILAPIVSERKGEFVDLFQDLQAQGFVRFRVRSGGGTANLAKAEIFEVDRLPTLKKNDKHSIEVVVDRIKVRPDIQQRLAESFETALRLADGKAMIVDMDTGKEMIFSSKFACQFVPTHYKSLSHASSPSIIQWVLAHHVMVSGISPSSIQNASWHTLIYRSLQVQSRAGTDAISSISNCYRPLRSMVALT